MFKHPILKILDKIESKRGPNQTLLDDVIYFLRTEKEMTASEIAFLLDVSKSVVHGRIKRFQGNSNLIS